MRIQELDNGYKMSLSARDTYAWAHKPGASWPCSTVEDGPLWHEVDSNGLCDINDADLDETELAAIVADHLPDHLRKYWPAWA